MFDRISRSWELTRQSWQVLRADKHLMVFPLISAICITIVSVSMFIPAALMVGLFSGEHAPKNAQDIDGGTRAIFFGMMFLLYFFTFSIGTFFNAALIACAMNRFNGEDSSAKAGLAVAVKRLPQILAWALVNATVGVLLQMLKERAGWIGRIVLGFVGMAWAVATFFVTPVLVVEGVGPIKAVKRSMEVLKKTWGESLVSQVGVGAAMGLIAFGTLMVFVGVGLGLTFATGSPWPIAVLGPLGLLAMMLVVLVGSTLKMILVAACYRYAATGMVPEQFDGGTLRGMFGQKR
jgi:hypothetical protein